MLQLSVIDDKAIVFFFFFQAEDGIRDVERSRGLGDVYKRQVQNLPLKAPSLYCKVTEEIGFSLAQVYTACTALPNSSLSFDDVIDAVVNLKVFLSVKLIGGNWCSKRHTLIWKSQTTRTPR
eukprot:TRINITY_DN25102_c0_g1_i2.p2 TRINITY_DN25102_c0_g1~~TRINITY_DN25102_c0_g1_i2.p2  ORF type:complete len:122 (-),score=17.48 TRINITY_DN25102_c0_g1_i2:229-594(-)